MVNNASPSLYTNKKHNAKMKTQKETKTTKAQKRHALTDQLGHEHHELHLKAWRTVAEILRAWEGKTVVVHQSGGFTSTRGRLQPGIMATWRCKEQHFSVRAVTYFNTTDGKVLDIWLSTGSYLDTKADKYI